MAELRARRDTLAAENATNPAPRRTILRLDGGFGDAAAVAGRYEQGYDFGLRAHNHRVAAALRTEAGLTREKVGQNGFIARSQRTSPGACRQWRGPTGRSGGRR